MLEDPLRVSLGRSTAGHRLACEALRGWCTQP